MKLAKLSLAALMALGTSSFAADTLADAFKNGKFGGELRFVYVGGSQSDISAAYPTSGNNVGSIAVEMQYKTADFHGFQLGFGFQSAHDLQIHDENGAGLDNEDDARNSVSESHLSEAYLQYNFMKSNIKIGNQKIKTPLIMTSTAFALEDYFEAAVATINEIPNTMIQAIYIQEWHKRYGAESASWTQDDAHYDDGLYSLYFKNNSIKGLTLDGQYLTTNEEDSNGDAPVMIGGGYDQYYIHGKYQLPTDFPLSIGLKYGGADFDVADGNGKDDTDFYAMTVGTKMGGVILEAAYSSMSDDRDFPATLGHFPDAFVFPTGMLSNNSFWSGVDAYSIQAVIPRWASVPGLFTRFKIAHFEQSEEGQSHAAMNPPPVLARNIVDGATEVNAHIIYRFSGALKGLSTTLFAGYTKYDDKYLMAGGDDDDLLYGRFYLKYNF